MALSGSGVQSGSNGVAVGLSDGGHGYLFGNVLADQAVEIFVGSPFPRMVGSSEVALQREVSLYLCVTMEFSTVVKGDRLKASLVFINGIQGGLCSGGRGSRFQLLDDREAGFSFNESENAVMPIAADHSVSLPMTESRTGFDRGGALRDVALAWQNSA